MRESIPSILKLYKSLSHLRNLRANLNITKMQSLYKCTEGVVAKLSQWRQSKQLHLTPSFASILRFPNELHVLITYTVSSFQRLWPYLYTNKYRQIKFRMKVYNKLKHYQDAKFIQMYRRSNCKIESTKTKQTITNNDLVVDLPTKILDENINVK
jgi:ribosomal protein L18E